MKPARLLLVILHWIASRASSIVSTPRLGLYNDWMMYPHTSEPHHRSNRTLLELIVRDLVPSKAFEDVFHPLARDQPQLFSNIMSKALDHGDKHGFIMKFIKALPKELFDEYVIVQNQNKFKQPLSKFDLWKLLLMVNRNLVFDSFIKNASYIPEINKFLVIAKIKSSRLRIKCAGGVCINWSHIPPYLRSVQVKYLSLRYNVIHLLNLDKSSNLTSLEIRLTHGFILFPYDSFSVNLKILKLDAPLQSIIFGKLWSVSEHIEELSVYDHADIVTVIDDHDIFGIENMINLKKIKLTCCNSSMNRFAHLIKTQFEDAGIGNKTIRIECYPSDVLGHNEMEFTTSSDLIGTTDQCTRSLFLICCCIPFIAGLTFVLVWFAVKTTSFQ